MIHLAIARSLGSSTDCSAAKHCSSETAEQQHKENSWHHDDWQAMEINEKCVG